MDDFNVAQGRVIKNTAKTLKFVPIVLKRLQTEWWWGGNNLTVFHIRTLLLKVKVGLVTPFSIKSFCIHAWGLTTSTVYSLVLYPQF